MPPLAALGGDEPDLREEEDVGQSVADRDGRREGWPRRGAMVLTGVFLYEALGGGGTGGDWRQIPSWGEMEMGEGDGCREGDGGEDDGSPPPPSPARCRGGNGALGGLLQLRHHG